MPKKILTWAAVIFLVYFVVTRPTAASDIVKSIGGWLVDMGRGFGDFFQGIVS
jgi:hypothetical protein